MTELGPAETRHAHAVPEERQCESDHIPPHETGQALLEVSVIVPAYNAAGTIADTLESLISQTHPDWEAVVVDDGSTDYTAQIVRQFAARDSRIRLIQQSNGGEGAARNTGIARARFAWLAFLDADDWISPRHLQRLTEELSRHPHLDAVHCGYARVALDGTVVTERYEPPTGDLFPTLAMRAAFPVHTCIVRKSLVQDVGGFDETLRTSPDWDLWQRVARTGAQFGAVREVLAYYRMQPGSVSLNGRQLLQDGLRVLHQGHAADPRVPHPLSAHVHGMPREEVDSQQYYLLCWCAGLMLGSGGDPGLLFDLIDREGPVMLYGNGVAQCLFESIPLPTSQAPRSWEHLWPRMRPRIEDFLRALEEHAQARGLARSAAIHLQQMTLQHSPTWGAAIQEFNQAHSILTEDRDNWKNLAEHRASTVADAERACAAADRRAAAAAEAEHARAEAEHARAEAIYERDKWQTLADQRATEIAAWEGRHAEALEDRRRWESVSAEQAHTINEAYAQIDHLELEVRWLEEQREALRQLADERAASMDMLQQSLSALTGERNTLQSSLELRAGDLLLNRMRLKRPLLAIASGTRDVGHRINTVRLASEGRLPGRSRNRRILATICSNFPIYSQTFVHQELNQLVRQGFD
ncbi:MAG: glycosyltransferase, partial [Planctomycetaceae bacterium]|nr:glycosyltransferase [Planctomycetaceae bacterium]